MSCRRYTVYYYALIRSIIRREQAAGHAIVTGLIGEYFLDLRHVLMFVYYPGSTERSYISATPEFEYTITRQGFNGGSRLSDIKFRFSERVHTSDLMLDIEEFNEVVVLV